MSGGWCRVPLWAMEDGPSPGRARAWRWLLMRWHVGDDPGTRELMRAAGIGAGLAIRVRDEAAAWAVAEGARLPERLREHLRNTSFPESEHRSTVQTPVSDDSRNTSRGLPEHLRNGSRARDPLVGEESRRGEETVKADARPAAAVAPPASPPPVELFPAPPPPEPDPAPATPAKPARTPKAKPPRAEKPATPGYREAIDRWDRAYRDAHDGAVYPYVFTGRDSDAGHVRTVLAAARYTEADAAGALDRIENAARAYMAAAALGRAYPRGEPVSLRWFARDVAKWLRTDPSEAERPGEILTPDFRSGRRMSPQEEHVATLDWIAAARAKLAARSTPDADA